MKKCCKTTFKEALNEVIISLEKNKITSVDEVVMMLKGAVQMIEENEGSENEE